MFASLIATLALTTVPQVDWSHAHAVAKTDRLVAVAVINYRVLDNRVLGADVLIVDGGREVSLGSVAFYPAGSNRTGKSSILPIKDALKNWCPGPLARIVVRGYAEDPARPGKTIPLSGTYESVYLHTNPKRTSNP